MTPAYSPGPVNRMEQAVVAVLQQVHRGSPTRENSVQVANPVVVPPVIQPPVVVAPVVTPLLVRRVQPVRENGVVDRVERVRPPALIETIRGNSTKAFCKKDGLFVDVEVRSRVVNMDTRLTIVSAKCSRCGDKHCYFIEEGDLA